MKSWCDDVEQGEEEEEEEEEEESGIGNICRREFFPRLSLSPTVACWVNDNDCKLDNCRVIICWQIFGWPSIPPARSIPVSSRRMAAPRAASGDASGDASGAWRWPIQTPVSISSQPRKCSPQISWYIIIRNFFQYFDSLIINWFQIQIGRICGSGVHWDWN